MAQYATLKAAIDAVIKANGQREITGTVLNQTLNAMVNSLGANYQFAGVATPSTNPGTPDQNVFYLAGQGGTYTNFNSIVLPNGISFLIWNGSWSSQTVLTGDGGVFDLSAYNNGTTYADLNAALTALNALPAAYKKGGMSFKFVQSSDNKYVQYRLTVDEFTTDITKWQNVGDFLEEKEISYSEEDVAGYITDKKGTIIGKLMKSGAIERTVKNSRDILLDTTVANLATQGEKVDELDENAVREVTIDDVEEDVVSYITDRNGAILAKILKGGAIERTVDNQNDIVFKTLISNVGELYGNTLQESIVEIEDESVAGYITDKNKAILAKINKDGSIDRIVENDLDKHTVHFEDVNIDGIVNLLVDKKNKVVASINDKAEIDFYGGGGFAGEKTVEANTDGYIRLITSKNGVVIGGIKHDGTVKMFNAEIDNFTAQLKSLPIIASGLDNIKLSNDKRVLNLLTSVNTTKVFVVQGENIKSKLKPCISIIDDDTIDRQIPSSFGGSTPSSNVGGYFSVLLPLMLSLGAKYNKTLCPGLACEGQRVGLTKHLSDDDTYTVLNENGNCVKWLHDNVGWEVLNHSMTAQLSFNTYYVDGINSGLADKIKTNTAINAGDDPTSATWKNIYRNPRSFYNVRVIDRLTGKWYELNNQHTDSWEEVSTKKYGMPFYQEYINPNDATANHKGSWYFNRDFDFEYSWGEWFKRAEELGLPFEKVIVHNGDTSSVWMASEGRKYANYSIRTTGTHNYPPIPAMVNRVNGIKGTGNVTNPTYKAELLSAMDACISGHTWVIFMTHFNDETLHNFYYDGVTYPDKDLNYSSEWIVPLTYTEIQDIVGTNEHDYINHPPSRLNISTWDEWIPASGTKLKDLYDVLDYALSHNIEFVTPTTGWSTHGNLLNIGVDRNGQTYYYDNAVNQTPYTEEELSFLTIGADGSIRYFSI